MVETARELSMDPPFAFPSFFAPVSVILISVFQIIPTEYIPPFSFEIFSLSTFIIACIVQILDEYPLNALERLGIHGPEGNGGRDYFSYIEDSPIKFWYLTGETLETFEEVLLRMRLPILALHRRNGARRKRIQKLTIKNRLLLTFIWLRRYPRQHTLASMFKVDVADISTIVKSIVPLLLETFSNEIQWPTVAEWQRWIGYWKKFPTCVGIVDATVHEIWRPSKRQAYFYRGDKKKHFMASHLIVTPDGMIVHCSAS